jgi:hypothetical protein
MFCGSVYAVRYIVESRKAAAAPEKNIYAVEKTIKSGNKNPNVRL